MRTGLASTLASHEFCAHEPGGGVRRAGEARHLALRGEFLLDPSVVFLNHGSFGACPRPVFEAYQRWQLELERQPVEFLSRRQRELLTTARAALAELSHASGTTWCLLPNVTTALNVVARSLPLQPGDEILTTDHEYGALERTWTFVVEHRQARLKIQELPRRLDDPSAVVEAIWAGVTPRTQVLFLSHITSPTAVILPIEPLIARARAAGIWTVIDGAHAPGQVDLDLQALGVDFYGGNCHKWLSSAKGRGLPVRPPRGPGPRRAAGGELGLAAARRVVHAIRRRAAAPGDPRHRRVPGGARRDRVPAAARLASRAPGVPRARAPRARRV